MKKFTKLTRQQIYDVGKAIEQSGQRDGDKWVYAEGSSDQTVATSSGVDVEQVIALRLEIFGKVRSGPGTSTIWNAVHDLKARVEELEAQIAKSEKNVVPTWSAEVGSGGSGQLHLGNGVHKEQ